MKNIIVTGCSSGIGKATVRWLSTNTEHTIIGIARRQDRLNEIAKQLNQLHSKGKFIPIVFDLSEINKFHNLIAAISKHISEVNILINNAATLLNKAFEQTKPEEFDAVFQLNVKSVYFLTQQLLPIFSKPSHILNIASMGGFQGSVKFPGLSVYSASKAALSNLTESLATELSDLGISVNAIAPGAVQTEMLEHAFPGYKAQITENDMGAFIAQFALEGNKFFNGKILPASISTP